MKSTTFELLQGARFFTKLDLQNAYHLVRIIKGDEWKTTFNMLTRHYEYLILPFGLTNVPAVFQVLVNDVLCDFVNCFVFCLSSQYFEFFSPTLQSHHCRVRQVLWCLQENQLYAKAEKCEFHKETFHFWALLFPPVPSRWTLARSKQSLNGLLTLPIESCNISLALLISREDSSATTARLWLPSHHPSICFSVQMKLTRSSPCLNLSSPLPLF